jgi:hypothetical protein
MNSQIKRTIKRILVKTVKPPLKTCSNLLHRVIVMEDPDEGKRGTPTFNTTYAYLHYWHGRIVGEVHSEFGGVTVPGFQTARPQYVWGVVWGAYLAKALGIKRISVMELGVAGGNGLVVLEVIAEKVKSYLGIDIDVYGFDSGAGSPKPTDYRDAPNLLQEGVYPMDAEKLKKRLRTAELLLGPIDRTIQSFIESKPAPVAFVAFDMLLYSATIKALKLFEADEKMLLPRIQCYFGACMGHTHSDFTTDRAAISEFNDAHKLRKISLCYGLDTQVEDSTTWAGRMFLAHIFDHSLYGANDGLITVRDNPLIV